MPPSESTRTTAGEPPITVVLLTWRREKEQDWIRFGEPVGERILDRRRRIECYRPGQVFALIRWASNDFGTTRSTLQIVRAVGYGEAFTTIPAVTPGGELLLSVTGWFRVRAVLAHIDSIEAAGIDPVTVAPDHWHHVHNRLAAGQSPRSYSEGRHRAWLARREIS